MTAQEKKEEFKAELKTVIAPVVVAEAGVVLEAVDPTEPNAAEKLEVAVQTLRESAILASEGGLESISKYTSMMDKHFAALRERLKRDRDGGVDTNIFFLLLDIQGVIDANNERMQELQGEIDALQGVLDDMAAGKVVLNPDGTLKDPEAEAIVAEYEKQHGVKVDRSDPEAIQKVIDYKREQIRSIEKTNDDLKKTLDEGAKIAKVEIDNGNIPPKALEVAYAEMGDEAEKVQVVMDSVELNEADKALLTGGFTGGFGSMPSETIGTENPFTKGEMTNSFGGAVHQPAEPSNEPAPEDNNDMGLNRD